MKTIHQEENTGPEYFRESWYVMSTLTAAAPQHGETPRTQAFLESPPPCSPAFDVQWLNFCRTLERELNEAKADNARLYERHAAVAPSTKERNNEHQRHAKDG